MRFKISIKRFLALFVTLLLFLAMQSCNAKKTIDFNNDEEYIPSRPVYVPNVKRLLTAIEEVKTVTGNTEVDTLILIDGYDNKLFLVSALPSIRILKEYTMSASKYGYGPERGSNKTPWGVHKIDSKYGDGAPAGMCFYDRRPTGEIATIYTDTTNVDKDPVTSRIIWLKGLEEINRTSYWRFVYIHGTHEEGLLGTPQSHGCIRLSNHDVIELFDLVHEGTYVNIIRPLEDNSTTNPQH